MRNPAEYQRPAAPDAGRDTDFTQLYLRYQAFVLSCLRAYPIDPQQAEDLSQEVFLKVFLHMDQALDVDNIRAWLRQIAHNTYVSSLRKWAPQTVQYAEYPASAASLSWDGDTAFSLVEWRDVFQRAAGEYSMDYWVGLWSFAGYSSQEIAAMLGLTSQSVRHRLCRLRKRMRAAVPNR